MADDYLWAISVLNTATVALGATFLYFTWRAWRKYHSSHLAFLFAAVAILTFAAAAEGVLYELVGLDLVAARVFEASVTLVGFAVLVYSIRRRSRQSAVPPVVRSEAAPEGVDLRHEP